MSQDESQKFWGSRPLLMEEYCIHGGTGEYKKKMHGHHKCCSKQKYFLRRGRPQGRERLKQCTIALADGDIATDPRYVVADCCHLLLTSYVHVFLQVSETQKELAEYKNEYSVLSETFDAEAKACEVH